MARSRTPNGRLGKAVKAVVTLLGEDNIDPDQLRMKMRSVTNIAGNTDALRRMLGEENWVRAQQILSPHPKPPIAA